MKTTASFRIEDENLQKLKYYCFRKDMRYSELINKLIERFLEENDIKEACND